MLDFVLVVDRQRITVLEACLLQTSLFAESGVIISLLAS
jgi:hypothetical protein